MPEVTLDLIFELLQRQQAEQADIRAALVEIHTTLTDLGDGQTVLTQMVLRLERDMVRVKELLGSISVRVSHLEPT